MFSARRRQRATPQRPFRAARAALLPPPPRAGVAARPRRCPSRRGSRRPGSPPRPAAGGVVAAGGVGSGRLCSSAHKMEGGSAAGDLLRQEPAPWRPLPPTPPLRRRGRQGGRERRPGLPRLMAAGAGRAGHGDSPPRRGGTGAVAGERFVPPGPGVAACGQPHPGGCPAPGHVLAAASLRLNAE